MEAGATGQNATVGHPGRQRLLSHVPDLEDHPAVAQAEAIAGLHVGQEPFVVHLDRRGVTAVVSYPEFHTGVLDQNHRLLTKGSSADLGPWKVNQNPYVPPLESSDPSDIGHAGRRLVDRVVS